MRIDSLPSGKSVSATLADFTRSARTCLRRFSVQLKLGRGVVGHPAQRLAIGLGCLAIFNFEKAHFAPAG
ncbi:hypothetical protein [Pseudogemmobacter sonorensis]|uniref:hypothetical protein n=1 Tax=Pseudogemmobacter sonorensis TaxID=2989681 RepID=UPI0036CA2D17